MLYSSSEVTKQASLANTGSTNHLIGSFLDCGKDTTAENDGGIQSAEVLAQKLESNSKKRCPEAVINGSPSISGGGNEVTDNVDVPCQSKGVNFNDYFAPRKQDLDTVGSAEVLVDEATKTNVDNGTVKAKNRKKNKKHGAYSDGHDAHSDSPPSDSKTPLMLNSNHGLGAKPHTGNSSPVEVQVSFTKANSGKTTLQPNKEPSEVSDTVAKPMVSSKSHKDYSVPEEAPRSNDAKPAGAVNGLKSKKAEPKLESSKNIQLLRTRVNGHHSLEDHNHKVGRKASAIKNGEVVNSSKQVRSLLGVSGSIFKDDSSGEASSNEYSNSDASTRTPSDASLSSDYSDGESNADYDSSQSGSCSWKREEGGRKSLTKPIPSGMTLDEILKSSRSYKKAKLTASQSQLEDPESLLPLDFGPDGQACAAAC